MGFRSCATLALVLLPASEASFPLQSVEGEVVVPPNWQIRGDAPRDQLLELTFAIKQQGTDELARKLLSVSDPSSPQYGQHLTNHEVQQLVAPERRHLEAVESFLLEHGLSPRRATPNGDFVSVVAPVQAAEVLLAARYVVVEHSSGLQLSRALSGYSLPAGVAEAIDFVAPTTHFPGVHRPAVPELQAAANASSMLKLFNSPKNLRSLYQVGSVEGKSPDNKQAVTAFLEQGYSEASLKIFWGLFCGGIRCGKGSPKLVGDRTKGWPGTEAMLDIETITGLAGNVQSEFWGFAGRSPDNPQNEPFMKWLQQLSGTSDTDVPKVFSTSYGEDESSWSLAAARRLNVEFQKAGVRGISLLFASGDSGPNCKDGQFRPQGPASSPWVTAVGGTSPGHTWPEPGPTAESGIGLSSGGFSDYWPMPSWQRQAVAGYLNQSGVPDATHGYNASGRAFPDIAAQATMFFVFAGLPQPLVAGTSCASPTAAAIFALLNDLRLQQGKSTLGFLNPLIYSHASAFNDITAGGSQGSCGGWPAKKGWDAATGVGTPSYESLAKVVSSLPAGRQTLATASDLVV